MAFRWTYALERALDISRDLFATPLPEGLLTELVARRPADENVGRVARWQGPGDRGTRLLARVAAMSWPDRVRYLVSFALPPPAYMRRRYHLSSGWQVPFAYPYRWLDVTWAVVKTLTRTARPGR